MERKELYEMQKMLNKDISDLQTLEVEERKIQRMLGIITVGGNKFWPTCTGFGVTIRCNGEGTAKTEVLQLDFDGLDEANGLNLSGILNAALASVQEKISTITNKYDADCLAGLKLSVKEAEKRESEGQRN